MCPWLKNLSIRMPQEIQMWLFKPDLSLMLLALTDQGNTALCPFRFEAVMFTWLDLDPSPSE